MRDTSAANAAMAQRLSTIVLCESTKPKSDPSGAVPAGLAAGGASVLTMRFDAVAAKLQCARAAIVQAEGDLESAIGEIRAAPRCEKVGMSEVLETAFEELRRAKAELARVEIMMAESDE